MIVLLCLLGFLLPRISISQSNYSFYISNSGSDSNSGTSPLLPRKTLTGTTEVINQFGSSHGNIKVGLASGSTFNESLSPLYPVQIGTYHDSTKKSDFAILNGSDVFDTGWKKAEGTQNTYQQYITHSDILNYPVGNNNYIYVVEIDKALEKTAPFTARKLLDFAPSVQAVDITPGSFYEPLTTGNSITVSIHTSDGSSPNSNPKYRYEVAIRANAVNSYWNDNNRFENLWLRGYGSGYGPAPGGANSYYNKVIFGPGAGIHHLVLKSGTINNSLFLPAAKNTSAFSIVFYDVEGLERHNIIANSIFLDIPTPIYTHTDHGSFYGALELNNVVAFAEGSQRGAFLSTSNNDSVFLTNVYLDGYNYGYNVGNNYISSKYSKIKNSYFKDVVNAIAYGFNSIQGYVDNSFIRLVGKETVIGISMESKTSFNLSNSILHIKNNATNNNAGRFITGAGQSANHISSTGNIFICDVDPGQSVIAAKTNTDNGAGTSSDVWNNNVYILLKGNKILWSVTNGATNNGSTTVQTFDEWKKQSGQDQNSLFFDLRNDPRGLQAVFMDPDNGNYELANTKEGDQIRALHAGMTTPITCFLKKPTYEEAADLLRNDKSLAINSCRYSCQQIKLNLDSSTPVNSDGSIGICLNQNQLFKASSSYIENDKYYHQSDATSRYTWRFSDGSDTSGTGLSSVTHKFTRNPENFQLQIVDQKGCSFDSTFKAMEQPLPAVKLGADTTICNGFDVTLSAMYPGATYLWSNGSTNNAITAKNKGVYWVQTTLNGCNFKDSIELKLQDCPCTVQMPNAFTPNRDGLNDVYKPVLGCLPTIFDFSIYNSWGKLVFSTTDYKKYWNGTLNGKRLPPGVYVYVLKTNSETLQKIRQLRGTIVLLR
jgi:gliding motility-associated-like protein